MPILNGSQKAVIIHKSIILNPLGRLKRTVREGHNSQNNLELTEKPINTQLLTQINTFSDTL